MGARVGIHLGPGRGHGAAMGLDPGNPDRLVFRKSLPSGTLIVLGIAAALCVHFAGTTPGASGLLAIAGALGLLFFGRTWAAVDRKRRVLETGTGVFFPLRLSPKSIEGIRSVVLDRKDNLSSGREGRRSVAAVFEVVLERTDGLLPVVTAGAWEDAVPAAETLSRFLGLPLDDRAQKTRGSPEPQGASRRPRAAPFEIPMLRRTVSPFLGLAVGALLGNLAPRPLGICIPMPFLEHLFNLGGMLGLLAGCVLERRAWFRNRPRAALWVALVSILGAACILGAARPFKPPFSVRPIWDEGLIFGRAGVADNPLYVAGWLVAGLALVAAADALASCAAWTALRIPWLLSGRFLREEPSRTRLWRLVPRGALFLVAVAGLSVLALIGDHWIRRRGPRWPWATYRHPEAVASSVAHAAPALDSHRASPSGTFRVEAEELDLPAGADEPDLPSEAGEAPAIPVQVEDDAPPVLEAVPEGKPVEVTRSHRDGFEAFTFGGGLSRAQFMGLRADGAIVWVGTDKGVLRFDAARCEAVLFGLESGIPGVRATSLEVIDGGIVADLSRPTSPGCCLGLGGWILDESRVLWKPLGPPSDGGFRRSGKILWIAAYRAVRLDLETGEYITYTRKDGLLHESVSAIATVGTEVWFSMSGDYVEATKDFTGGGVSRLDTAARRWTSYTTRDGLARSYTCDIAADARQVWAVHWDAEKGASIFDRRTGRWTALRRSANGILLGGTLVSLEPRAVWIGQGSGLARHDRETGLAKEWRERDGLPGYWIGGLDASGDAVWASAYSYDGSGGCRSAGLVRFPKSE